MDHTERAMKHLRKNQKKILKKKKKTEIKNASEGVSVERKYR